MKIQHRYVLSFVLILSLGACSSGDLPYPNLSTVPQKPIIRLTPRSQNTLKDNLQNDWHKAEAKHEEEKRRETQNAAEQLTTEQFPEETHVAIPPVNF
ncbi:MAG: hypothetical protein Q8L85_05350 [Alphaproteobacteria bacterium]|nr:hypothetical protein [Alphaproteobacteria bacterium]